MSILCKTVCCEALAMKRLKSRNILFVWPEIFVVKRIEKHYGFFNKTIFYGYLPFSLAAG